MDKKSFFIITLIIIFAFTIRFINFSHPSFTSEEARIAHRGYILAKYGTDELGRKFPLIFNSFDDYQLPVVSYITMIGTAIFGKTDLGARIPFVLIGTLLVFYIYKIGNTFNKNSKFGLISAFIAATSPTLVFLSKIPNEAIVLSFIFTYFFYLLINSKSLKFIIPTMIAAVLVSKFAWFILLPFLSFMWFFRLIPNYKRQFILLPFTLLIVVFAFSIFLTIPQSKRSLLENNFTIFSDVTIINGINALRGQGIQSGWPGLAEKLLFNKLHFLTTGILHWLSHFFNPALYFGQLDGSGKMSFSYLGAWTKVLIIPAIYGIFSIVKKGDRKSKLLLLLPLILTFPSAFIYPNYTLELVVLVLPFMAIIIALGCLQIIQINKIWVTLGLFLIIFELVINIHNNPAEYKNTDILRPRWIKEIAANVYKSSQDNQTAISDNVVSDVTAFINWYTPEGNKVKDLNIAWAYKFRQYNLSNIKIIGFDDKFRSCGKDEKLTVFASKRDLDKIQHEVSVKYSTFFKDSRDLEQIYLIDENICIN